MIYLTKKTNRSQFCNCPQNAVSFWLTLSHDRNIMSVGSPCRARYAAGWQGFNTATMHGHFYPPLFLALYGFEINIYKYFIFRTAHKKGLHSTPGEGFEPSTNGLQCWLLDYVITSDIHRRAGRLCRIIVGTHLLVSTPFLQPLPCKTWLGVGRMSVHRIHPVFSSRFNIEMLPCMDFGMAIRANKNTLIQLNFNPCPWSCVSFVA